MRSPILIQLLAAIAFFTFASANVVVDLTSTARFDASVGRDRPALVEFYAPWCGHCKKLEPEYEKAAAAFSNDPGRVLIGKVNADENKELGRRFGVRGYPTLKWFPFNSLEPEDYKGGRDAESIVKFINEKTDGLGKIKGAKPAAPPVAVQLNADNFDKIVKDEDKNVLVEFYAPWCGHCKNLAPVYEAVAKIFENDDSCVIAQMNADEDTTRPIASQYGVSSFPTLKFFPRGSDKKGIDYGGGRTEENFISWLNTNCGLHRLPTGALNDLAGRLPSLDAFASKFYAAENEAGKMDLVGEAKAWLAQVKSTGNATLEKNQAADYYLKVMTKTLTDPEYVVRESARLKKIMDKHVSGASQLAGRKVDDLKRRMNVLGAFTNRKLADRVSEKAKKAFADSKNAANQAKDQAQQVVDKVKDEL